MKKGHEVNDVLASENITYTAIWRSVGLCGQSF